MRFEDNSVGPEVRRAAVKSSEDSSFGVWKTPLRLVARVRVVVWRDDVDAGCFAQVVRDVCAGVLVAWWWWLLVSRYIGIVNDFYWDFLTSWFHGLADAIYRWGWCGLVEDGDADWVG